MTPERLAEIEALYDRDVGAEEALYAVPELITALREAWAREQQERDWGKQRTEQFTSELAGMAASAEAEIALHADRADRKEGQVIQAMHEIEDLRSALAQKADHAERAEAERDRLAATVERVRALADGWDHMNDAYRANPRREMRYFLEPENAANKLRAALADPEPGSRRADTGGDE